MGNVFYPKRSGAAMAAFVSRRSGEAVIDSLEADGRSNRVLLGLQEKGSVHSDFQQRGCAVDWRQTRSRRRIQRVVVVEDK